LLIAAAAVLVGPACGGDRAPGDDLRLERLAPNQVLAKAGDALRRVRSYHIESVWTGPDCSIAITGDITASGSARARFGILDRRVEFVVDGPRAFVNGNYAFWLDHFTYYHGKAPDRVNRAYAGQWIRLPVDRVRYWRSVLSDLGPRKLGRSLTDPSSHGTLRNEGIKTIDGHRVVVLRETGERPGTSPSELHIAATGPPLPLRSIGVSAQNAGAVGRCGDDSATSSLDVRLSQFNRPTRIAPPAGAISVSEANRRARVPPATERPSPDQQPA
jgi:hypothetical protein